MSIIVPTSTTKAPPVEAGGKPGGEWSFSGWWRGRQWVFWNGVWEFCKEDINRVTFSLKVGLAVLIVALLILVQAPYALFGSNIIWSILTVAIMFEYTVGATFNRGFNRALGSLLAGVLAIAIAQLALHTGHIAEPVIIGASIFLVGTITSFMKLWPSLMQYEYGFRVILFSFCLIIESGYRIGDPFQTAMDRLYSIAIGGFVAVLVNVLIFPIWAGEQLHKELVNSFNNVAAALEECVGKYLEGDRSDKPEFSTAVMDEFQDEPAYRKCRDTLNSSAKLDSLATSAKWEPPHGRFRCFFYPWSEYVKVGAVLRFCAYEVMALHGVLHSEIQAPQDIRIRFRPEIQDATNQAAELVRSLAKDIGNMKQRIDTSLQKRVHNSTETLQHIIDIHAFLLTATGNDRSNQFRTDESHKSRQEEFCDEMVKKHSRKLHSWPAIEVGTFDEEMGVREDFAPKMRALESTASLSLAMFTSLIIEFVARLDHLVEAVDRLSKMAKFKHEGI